MANVKHPENVATQLEELIECSVCFETPKDHIYQCENGHLYCSECRVKLEKCAICREPLANSRCLMAEKVISILKERVKNEPNQVVDDEIDGLIKSLETLKVKRTKYLEKIMEARNALEGDKMSQKEALRKDVQKAKHETKEVIEAKVAQEKELRKLQRELARLHEELERERREHESERIQGLCVILTSFLDNKLKLEDKMNRNSYLYWILLPESVW